MRNPQKKGGAWDFIQVDKQGTHMPCRNNEEVRTEVS